MGDRFFILVLRSHPYKHFSKGNYKSAITLYACWGDRYKPNATLNANECWVSSLNLTYERTAIPLLIWVFYFF